MDRILSREDEILPSSGFAVSVMEAVRREAAAPPPIPFPWKRALPGLVVAGLALAVVLVAGVVAIVQLGSDVNGRAVFHALPACRPSSPCTGVSSLRRFGLGWRCWRRWCR